MHIHKIPLIKIFFVSLFFFVATGLFNKVDAACSSQCGWTGSGPSASCTAFQTSNCNWIGGGLGCGCMVVNSCGTTPANQAWPASCNVTGSTITNYNQDPACCGISPVCGNGSCEAGESTATCPGDCPASGGGPTSPPSAGSCDGCMDSGSCALRGGSFGGNGSNGCNPAVGGYCSATTTCGGNPPPTSPPGTLSCGQSCTSDSQCRNPSAAGFGTTCRGGICENAFCAPGQTIPGANCSCGSSTRLCGQTCGSAGFCAAGQGFCTHVNPAGQWYDGQPDCYDKNTYCAGSQNGYSQPNCVYSDSGNSYLRRNSDGNWKTLTTTLPSGDVEKSCQLCGDGFKISPEQCDDGALNGTSSSNCNKFCQFQSLTITANNTSGTITVASGSNVTLDWFSLGITNLVATDNWSGAKTDLGTQVINNITTNSTFTITGTQISSGVDISASVTVNIIGLPTAPIINLSVNGSSAPLVYVKPMSWASYWAGTNPMNTTFKWSTVNAVSCVGTTKENSCQIYPFPSTCPYVWSVSVAGWFLWNRVQPVTSPANPVVSIINDPGYLKYGTFKLTCTSAGGLTSSKQVVVSSLPPTTGGNTGPGQCGLPDPNDPAPPVCAPNPPAQNGSVTWTWPAVANADQYSIQIVDGVTGVVVPVVGIPVGFVNGQAKFGCRMNQVIPDTCSYTTNLPPGEYRSKIQAHSSTALCSDSGISTFPANGTPGIIVNLCPAVAWWQSGDGSIFTQGNIQSIIPVSCTSPSCINHLIQDGTNGVPGISIGGASGNTNTGIGTVSSTNWLAQCSLSGRVPDYDSFVSLIPVSITPTDTGATCGGGTFNASGATTGDGYYWYRHNGDLSITSDVNLNPGRKVILYVDGDLSIKGKITYNPANAFFMPIVKGNISVDPTVTTPAGTPTLTGIFYCGGHFATGPGHEPLNVLGSVVSIGGVTLERDLMAGNNNTPAESFSVSPDLILNYPGALSFKRPVWSEVAP